MKQRLLAIFCTISLSLCILAAILWIGSYRWQGYAPVLLGDRTHIYIGSGNGTIVIRDNRIVSPAEIKFAESVDMNTEPAMTLTVIGGYSIAIDTEFSQHGGSSIKPAIRA